MRSSVRPLLFLAAAALVGLFLVAGPFQRKDASPDTTSGIVAGSTWTSLLLGPQDMPFDLLLWSLRRGRTAGLFGLEEVWHGPLTGRPGALETTRYTLEAAIEATDSPQAALEVVDLRLREVAQPAKEVSPNDPLLSFSDRAWYGSGYGYGARVIFVRRNVVADVSMSNKEGLKEETIVNVVRILGRKIEAALAGKPEPPPILPPSVQELRVDSETAWRLRDLGARAWGEAATTIALYDANGIPRSLPAKQIGPNDYLVPLRHVAAILGPRSRVKAVGEQARVTLAGKNIVLKSGTAEVQVDQRAVQLSQPVQFVQGEVLVPLSSLVEQALGQRLSWQQRDKLMIGRLAAAG